MNGLPQPPASFGVDPWRAAAGNATSLGSGRVNAVGAADAAHAAHAAGAAHAARAAPAAHAADSAGGDAPLRCFLVEDNAVIRQNLIATLEEMLAVEVIGSAEDEPAAVQWMRTPGETADLMIVDIFLKSGTGLGVLARARELCPDTRLVVLSNYATPDMRRRCLAMGAERVFDKSAELEEMLEYCAELTEH